MLAVDFIPLCSDVKVNFIVTHDSRRHSGVDFVKSKNSFKALFKPSKNSTNEAFKMVLNNGCLIGNKEKFNLPAGFYDITLCILNYYFGNEYSNEPLLEKVLNYNDESEFSDDDKLSLYTMLNKKNIPISRHEKAYIYLENIIIDYIKLKQSFIKNININTFEKYTNDLIEETINSKKKLDHYFMSDLARKTYTEVYKEELRVYLVSLKNKLSFLKVNFLIELNLEFESIMFFYIEKYTDKGDKIFKMKDSFVVESEFNISIFTEPFNIVNQ